MSPSNELSGPQAEQTLTTNPLSFSPRIFSLDVLRGIAVMAALFVSIWVFGGFSTNQQQSLLQQSKGFDYRLFSAVELFLQGKMSGLIALVFGAAMLLFLTREQPRSISVADQFIRRQMWLIGFGIVNAVLFLWTEDLLFHLGIMGILLFPFFRLSAKSLLIASLVVTLIYSGKFYWNHADDRKANRKYEAVMAFEKKAEKDSLAKARAGGAVKKDTLTADQQREKKAWEGIIAARKTDPKKDEQRVSALRAMSYGKVWNSQLPVLQAREAQWTYRFGIWDLCSMILLGMALFRMGFFTGKFSRGQYLLIAAAGIAAGLLLGWYRLHFNQISLPDYARFVQRHRLPYDIFFPFERLFLSVGLASTVLCLLNLRFLQWLWQAFERTGRMALTNYLLQSIFLTLFFYGYGLGYYARLSQLQLYFLAMEVIMVQIVFSVFWLRYYHYGPAEWLLRRLSYGKGLPMKKSKAPATIPELPLFS